MQIALRGKNGLGKYALIDDTDYELVAGYSWRGVISGNVTYAHTDMLIDGKWRTVRMHRVILQASASQLIDHINRDGLDNRRANLRIATHRQNRQNSKGHKGSTGKYKGVSLSASGNFWRATININGAKTHLGYFKTQWEAAQAYNDAARQYFGEYARLNELPDQPDPDDAPLPDAPKTSKYIGVYLEPERQRWVASGPVVNGKKRNLGRYVSEDEAARVRDAFCIENGFDVPLNFPHD